MTHKTVRTRKMGSNQKSLKDPLETFLFGEDGKEFYWLGLSKANYF
ncbi:hypothetical protein [Enterococcus gallinarum]|nr:hypothetical protein [Enterococcus gallinarum]MDG4599029.1 hypothetical protein [Enterococcus faecium]